MPDIRYLGFSLPANRLAYGPCVVQPSRFSDVVLRLHDPTFGTLLGARCEIAQEVLIAFGTGGLQCVCDRQGFLSEAQIGGARSAATGASLSVIQQLVNHP